MKCGTEDEDTDVLKFTSKIVPHGSGYDDGDNENLTALPGGDSRKRKQALQDIARESKVRTKNISELVSTMKVLVANSSSGGASESSSDGHEQLLG